MLSEQIASPASPFFAEWPLKDCRSAASKKLPAPHQAVALGKMGKWYGELGGKEDGGILVLPTGGGKTFTAVHFLATGPLSDGYKVLWLAHTHHLLEQAFHGFSDGLGHIREPRSTLAIRVVSGTPGHFRPRDINPTDDVIIGTLQTITNAHREGLDQLSAFIRSAQGKLFVVFDEAHHAPAPSYRKLLMALREEGAPALGLTATPTYSDETKKGWLKKLFPQGFLHQARAGDLIAQGILAKPHFERADTAIVPNFDEPDYQKWLGTYRDIPESVIDHLAKNAERNAIIAKTYVDNQEKYGKTLIFTDRWYQCEAIVESLTKHGIKADAVYSHVDAPLGSVDARRRRGRDENAKVLERFRNDEIKVLVNVRMLTEGTDLPDAQTVFLTRQTTSQILLTQMVGRALRGPKFNGTADAYIVSFVDEWQQAIRWAEYDPLADGQADDDVALTSKRPPLQLISIDLVKRLARRMDGATNPTSGSFTSLMPAGWYRVTFQVSLPESNETANQLVLVFDDESAGFKKLIASLLQNVPPAFEDEDVSFERERERLEHWRTTFFGGVARSPNDLLFEIFHVARHIAQGHGAPQFFSFEVRNDHDLDSVARRFIERDLGPRRIQDELEIEFNRKDRFWKSLFPRLEHFRLHYDTCQSRILTGGRETGVAVVPRADEAPSFAEPSEEVKEQVKRRDGNRCLACGATRGLQADHILAAYRGGANDMDHMQTLCRVCNKKKGIRTIFFTNQKTPLKSAPKELEYFDVPTGEDAGDRVHWERFMRRTLNFTFQCAAVSDVKIGAKGDGYYNWTIELVDGIAATWLKPHLDALLVRIQDARASARKPPIRTFTIMTPREGTRTSPTGTASWT